MLCRSVSCSAQATITTKSPFTATLKRPLCRISSTKMEASSSSTTEPGKKKKNVIICGGGVIGVCTALFLGRKGASVTLVEKSEVACAASGKAGGFLALDWCDGGPLSGLARASFRLHEELSQEFDGPDSYGYRRLDTISLSVNERKASGDPARWDFVPSWVDSPGAGSAAPIGTTSTTAQVHPGLFCRTLVSAAQEKYGAKIVTGSLEKIEFASDGITAIGVWVDGRLVPGDAVVLALGPWSSKNETLASLFSISGLKAHSIVLRPQQPDTIGPHALFLKFKSVEGRSMDPEVYPRPTGEVYICGMSEDVEVPDSAVQVLPRRESILMLQRVAKAVSTSLAEAELKAEQACLLPCSEDGKPVIGKLPDMNGVYVGTGHSCWGILNGPATGASLAELIIDGDASLVYLKPFDPARFKKSSLRTAIN